MFIRASNAAIAAALTPPNEKPQEWDVRPELTQHPDLWRGLKMCLAPAWGLQNIVDNAGFSVVSAPAVTSVGPEGVRLGDGTEEFGLISPSKFNVTDKLSVFWRGSQRKGSQNFDRIFEIGGYSARDGGLSFERNNANTTTFRLYVFGSVVSDGGTLLGSVNLTENQTYSVAVTSDAIAPSNILYVDNDPQITDTTTARVYDDPTEIALGCYLNGASNQGPLITEVFYEWEGRILTAAERAILDDDPFALIRPDPTKIIPRYFPAAASGTTLSPGTEPAWLRVKRVRQGII